MYDPEQPLESVLNLSIEASSVACRDPLQKHKQQEHLTEFARSQGLAAAQHPLITVKSQRFMAKPLRGFVAEGTLSFRGVDRLLKANIGFGVPKKDRLQIDADATLRLSEYDVPRPSSLFGLIRTEDDVVLHALIWGVTTTNVQATAPSTS